MEKLLFLLVAFLCVALADGRADETPAPAAPAPDADAWKDVHPGQTVAADLEKRVGAPARRFKLEVPRDAWDYQLDDPWIRDNPFYPKPDPKVVRVPAEVWVYEAKPARPATAAVRDTRVVMRDGKVWYLRTWPRADEATLPAAKERHGKHPLKTEREIMEIDVLAAYDEYSWRQAGVVLLADSAGDEDTRAFKLKLLVPPVAGDPPKDEGEKR